MRYFLGYNIEGEAKWYHTLVTSDLSEKFGIIIHRNPIPAHFTFVPPFDANEDELLQIEFELEKRLEYFKPFPLLIEGFGHFHTTTIFLNTTSTVYGHKCINEIEETLLRLPFLNKVDTTYTKNRVLHASIARFLTEEQFKKIWNYLQHITPPRFVLLCDAVTLYVRIDEEWQVYACYPFGNKKNPK